MAELSDKLQAPVVNTLLGKGAVDETTERHLGMPGMHGTYTAITAMQKADLLIAVGARFDDRVTGNPATFAPEAKVIHVDVDPAEIGKVRTPEVPIVGDALRKAVSREQQHAEIRFCDALGNVAHADEIAEGDALLLLTALRETIEVLALMCESAGDSEAAEAAEAAEKAASIDAVLDCDLSGYVRVAMEKHAA